MANDITAIKPELDKLTQIIVNTVPVEQIYLFGSYAYGKPHKDSDFDIYVVLKDDAPMRELDAMTSIGVATFMKIDKPMDILARKKTSFFDHAQAFTLEKTILEKGIAIYE